MTCLAQQPPPVTGCVKVELHSACAPRLLEATVARTHTLLFLARWVARSSVGSRVAPSPSWSPLLGGRQPLRCRSGLSVRRSTSGRPPPWCPQGGLLPAGSCWTRLLSSMWGDWIVIVQGDIGSDPSSPRRVTREHPAAHAVSPRARSCTSLSSPFSPWSSTRLERGTLAGSTPAPYGAS